MLFFGGLEDDYAINTHVTIRGHVSTRFVSEEDRTRYIQEYVGEEIEASKRPLSAFIEDRNRGLEFDEGIFRAGQGVLPVQHA